MGETAQVLLELMAGSNDDAKLARHRFMFGQYSQQPECPASVSHDELRAAAMAELGRRRSEMRKAAGG
ncbi:MAG TPA: hypothetical protein VM869_19335 [Enhygromyxa sp.]|nr:hypothetical protein [Enhygromyxa sp.]